MQMRDAVATLPDFVGRKYSKHPPGYGSVTDKTGIRNRETRASIGWLRMTRGYGCALYVCVHTRGRASLQKRVVSDFIFIRNHTSIRNRPLSMRLSTVTDKKIIRNFDRSSVTEAVA